jgi:hypothetical protein
MVNGNTYNIIELSNFIYYEYIGKKTHYNASTFQFQKNVNRNCPKE